jgi:hypothetical protein
LKLFLFFPTYHTIYLAVAAAALLAVASILSHLFKQSPFRLLLPLLLLLLLLLLLSTFLL